MADPLADNANVDALLANIEEVSRLAEESLASAPLGLSSSAASILEDEGSAAPRRSTRRRRASSAASATEAGAAKRSRSVSDAGNDGITAAAVASSSSAPSLLAVTEDMLSPAALQQWRDDDTLPAPQRIDRLKSRVLSLSDENTRLRSLVSSLAGAGADGAGRLAALLAAGQPTNVVPGVQARGDAAAINAVARAVLRQQSEAAAVSERVTTVEGRQAMAAAREAATGTTAHQARRKNRKQPRKKAAVTPGLVLPSNTAPLDFTVVPDGFENMALGSGLKTGRPSKDEIAGVRTVVRCGRRVTTRFGFHGVSMDRRTQVFQGFIGVPSTHPAYDPSNKRPTKCGTARTPFLAALIREVRAVNVYRMTPATFPDFLWNFAEESRKWVDEDEVAFLGPDPELLPEDFNQSEQVPQDIPPPPRPTGSKEPPAEVQKFSQRSRAALGPKAPSDVAAFFGEEELTRHTAATADSSAHASAAGGGASGAASLAGDSLAGFDDLDLPDMDFDSINGDDEMGAVAEAAAAEFAEEYKAGQAGVDGYGFEALAAAGLEEVQGASAAIQALEGELGQRTRRSTRARGTTRKEHTTRHLLDGPHIVGAVGLPPPDGVDVGGEDPQFWRSGCRSNTGYYGVWRCDHPVQPYRGRIKVRKNEPKEHHETTAFRAAIAREIEALEPAAQIGSCTTRRFRWNFAHLGWVDYQSNADFWRWVGPMPSDLPPTATEDMAGEFWNAADVVKAKTERPYGSLHPERFPSSHSARKAKRTKAAARSRTATRAAAEAHRQQLMAELEDSLPLPGRRRGRGEEDEEREAAEAASAVVAAAGGRHMDASGRGGTFVPQGHGSSAADGGLHAPDALSGHDLEHDELVAAAEAALAAEGMDSAVL